MLDWPGLVAPRVVAARKKAQGRLDMIRAVSMVEPDWLVFRKGIEFTQAKNDAFIMLNYDVVREFNDGDEIKRKFPALPVIGYLLNDADHLVMRKKGVR